MNTNRGKFLDSSKVLEPWEARSTGIRNSGSRKHHAESTSMSGASEESSTGIWTNKEDNEDEFDWEREKQRKIQFYDDGTMTYFWRAHTLTVLFLIIGVLIYVGLVEDVREDTDYNAKRGMIACVAFFILLGVTVIPDGPFFRPHPAFWRLIFCISIVYQLSLIFLLFQSPTDARLLLRHVDLTLGEPLAEKRYGGNCLLYDPDNADPFHNIWGKLDLFVPMHFFGWWLKTMILRDWWLCSVISIMFEVLEHTLEHQIPNFNECWWDHWILDALLCNGLGIYVGIQTLKYVQIKTYCWRGLWKIPGYRGKLKRIFAQFGPHTWIEFDWKPTSSLGRWMAVLGIIFVFLLAELNTFYLKLVFWVPDGHWLNLVRLFGILLWGAVGLRETFQYLDDAECKRFGRQSWIILAIVSTEFAIVAKFYPATFTKPIPKHIAVFWLIGIGTLALWTIFNFGIYRTIIRSPKHKPLVASKSENDILHHNRVLTKSVPTMVKARKSNSETSVNYSVAIST